MQTNREMKFGSRSSFHFKKPSISEVKARAHRKKLAPKSLVKMPLVIIIFLAFILVTSAFSNGTPRIAKNPTRLALVGDILTVKTGPLSKNILSVTCEIKGDSLILLERKGFPGSGYVFRLKAVKPGEATVIEEFFKQGKRKKERYAKKLYVKVFSIGSIPHVHLSYLNRNPKRFLDQLFIVSGTSRGWGLPKDTKTIWGRMITRSDWIIEDETGAAYITGIPRVEKGKKVSIVCQIKLFQDGSWALLGKKLVNSEPSGVEAVVKSSNAFATSFMAELLKTHPKNNIFFSPISLFTALSMTYAGAKGKTKEEMENVLHISSLREKVHPAISRILSLLESESEKKEGCKLHIANALWGEREFRFLKDFIDTIKKFYGGRFFIVDFKRNVEGARKRINEWIEKETEGKIKNLLKKGDIDPLTRLVITNAIYFKGFWASKFDKKATENMPFYVAPGKSVNVPMMQKEGDFLYGEAEGFKAIELPYKGGKLSMLIILPCRSNWFTEKLPNIGKIASSMRKMKVRIYLPRFKLNTRYYLGKILSSMGMSQAFSDRADFSGMTGDRSLKISKVIHQAYVSVDEEGTEAAAATGVVMRLKAIMRVPVFKADHPFIFFIKHIPTGEILFMGRVANPKEKQ